MATASLWDRTGQSKYTATTFLKPLIMFSLEGREAEIIAAVLLTLLSAIKLVDHRVREGSRQEPVAIFPDMMNLCSSPVS